MKKLAILIVTSIILISCQAQPINLTLKLEKGKEYKQITSSKTSVIEDINGQEFNMTMIVKGTMNFLVRSINANDYLMEAKYESLSMTMSLPQGNVEFNSEKQDETDIMSTILASLKNKSFEVLLNKTGKVINVKGIDVLWSSMFDIFPQLTDAQKSQLKEQIMKAYGEAAFKGNIEMVTAIFPGKPVKKGDKWKTITNLESGFSATINNEYEFISLEKDYAQINGNSTIQTADKDAYIESNGMPMKYDMNGTMTSEIKVDNKTGWIIEAKINQKMGGNAYIKENPKIPDGMKIPININSETIINSK